MNLLEEKWLPVRRRDGALDWIAPHQVGDPGITAFAAPRADFNGALAQLMIGLLQTTAAPDDESGWAEWFDEAPSPETLQTLFAPVGAAFGFDGEGARFMQDFEMTDGTRCTVDALLIDAAGGSAIDKNTDHFVKRNTIEAICPHCAALALFTLQTNAPAGGAGHRTSLRGGGPLTTLLLATPSRSLWHDLWLNVRPGSLMLAQGGDVRKTQAHFTFPWLAPIERIQVAGGETQPRHVHPHHVFWAMPRRIRLTFDDQANGQCDMCKRPLERLVRDYLTRPQGLNYKGAWRHPFSPYYESKEGWLPVHPQPGGFSYKNWAAWVVGRAQAKKEVQPATIVNYALGEGRQKSDVRLWVFGFDMDNMKARCWYETTFPLYRLAHADRAARKALQALTHNLIEASEQVLFFLRQAVRHAWFGEAESRGDFSFIDKSFWDGTQVRFYQQLGALIERARSEDGIDLDDAEFVTGLGEAWRTILSTRALRLFDFDLVGAGAVAQQNPRRMAEARRRLTMNLGGDALKKILLLPTAPKGAKAAKKDKPPQAPTANPGGFHEPHP